MNATPLQPVAAHERIAALDVLRGFALGGILLMNIEGFVGPLAASYTGLDPALAGADRIADGLVYFFVQGKFIALFSLLFGIGFAVMAQRAERAGRPFERLYLRRALALLGIGLVHALLLWSGDVLVMYALLAFPLLAFREAPARALAWLGVACYLAAPALLLGLGLMASRLPGWDAMMAGAAHEMDAVVEAQRQAYGSGDFGMAVAQRVRDFGAMLSNLMIAGAMTFGLFLLGAALAQAGVVQHPERHARLYDRLRWVAMPLGLLAMLASFLLGPTLAFGNFTLRQSAAQSLGMVAGGLMCFGYFGWVLRGLEIPVVARWLAWLAPAGRMALTNYLVQSLACTLLFYGYGLGLGGRLPRFWQVPFALGLFAIQVLYSAWWLQRFRFGPVEWLWRSLTYRKLQPMRRQDAEVSPRA